MRSTPMRLACLRALSQAQASKILQLLISTKMARREGYKPWGGDHHPVAPCLTAIFPQYLFALTVLRRM